MKNICTSSGVLNDLTIENSLRELDEILSDFATVCETEGDILTTENSAEISKVLKDMGWPEELTAESALKGGGFFKSLKSVKDNIFGAGSSHVDKTVRKMETKTPEVIKELTELKSRVSGASSVTGNIDEDTAKAINNKLGLFYSLGNKFNSKDLIKYSSMPEEVYGDLISDTLNILDVATKKDFFSIKTKDFEKAVMDGELKPSKKAQTFFKSMKDIEFKDEEIILGYPVTLYGKNAKILTLRWLEKKNKIAIDFDEVEVEKDDKLKALSQKECEDLLDEAIKVVKNADSLNKKINGEIKKRLPGFLKDIEDSGEFVFSDAIRKDGGSSFSSFMNKMVRVIGNLWTAMQNISFASYEFATLAKTIAKASIETEETK